MALIELNKDPSHEQLASFGRLWTPVFAMILSTMCWNAGLFIGCVLALTAGVIVSAIAWMNPMCLKGIFVGATLVTFPIGVVLGFGLLAGVYYLCIVPIGLMLRWLKKDPLFKELNVTAESYWIERTESIPVARYFKQF